MTTATAPTVPLAPTAEAHGVLAVGQELIVAGIGGGRYAVPMDQVAEVGRAPQLTRVPGLPGWVMGVANWRGRVLAVLDLSQMLGGAQMLGGGQTVGPPAAASPRGPAARTGSDRAGRLLVLTDGTMRVGLLTDGVEAAAQQGRAMLPPPANLGPRAAGLVSGQLQDSRGVLGLLSVSGVMALSASLPRPR